MKVAGLFPSRGLVGSRMMEAVDQNLEGVDHVKIYSHDRPIPESFNDLTRQFLETDCDFAWFVEEDIVPPQGALAVMFETDAAIAFVDYPLKNFPDRPCFGTYRSRLIWVGLGCTLVRRAVFEKLEHPWFESQWKYVAVHKGSAHGDPKVMIVPDPDRPYGGQDLFFCYKALESGFDIRIVMGMRCRHPVPFRFRPILNTVEVHDIEATEETDATAESRKSAPEPVVLGQPAY